MLVAFLGKMFLQIEAIRPFYGWGGGRGRWLLLWSGWLTPDLQTGSLGFPGGVELKTERPCRIELPFGIPGKS